MSNFYQDALDIAETMITELSIENSKMVDALRYIRCHLAGEIDQDNLEEIIDNILQDKKVMFIRCLGLTLHYAD